MSLSLNKNSAINRRIMFNYETIPAKKYFSQTIDVDLSQKGIKETAIPNLPGYYIRSAESAFRHTHQLILKGIKNITYRLGGGFNQAEDKNYSYAPLLLFSNAEISPQFNTTEALNKHMDFYRDLRLQFPSDQLYIIADPFGLAPDTSNGAWGVKDKTGNIDKDGTHSLLAEIADGYSESGVDALLTMGRVEKEVEITRRVIDKKKRKTKIYAFSQNVESKAAYVYLDKLNKADSYQKILPGNITEMKVRTILDIFEGVDAIIVKPSEHFHVLQFTKDFISNPCTAISFLDNTLKTNFFDKRQDVKLLCEKVCKEKEIFSATCSKIAIGTYTVSGSFLMDKLLEEKKGEEFLFHVKDERFRNILSIVEDKIAHIIDRSSNWYLNYCDNSSLVYKQL